MSIKLLCNFIEITLRHGSFPANLLHIFKPPFHKSISERLLLLQIFSVSGSTHHVVIRSAFGDIVILILAISVLYEFKHRITIGSISAKKRKNVWYSTKELTEEYFLALIGIHLFKGNDYILFIFKRGE